LLDVGFDQAQVEVDVTDGFVMNLSPTTPEGSLNNLDSEINAIKNRKWLGYLSFNLLSNDRYA